MVIIPYPGLVPGNAITNILFCKTKGTSSYKKWMLQKNILQHPLSGIKIRFLWPRRYPKQLLYRSLPYVVL